MPVVSVGVDIDAPVDRVWEVLEPISSHSDWMTDADRIEFLTDQRTGVGTRFIAHTRVGPIRLQDVMEITAWEPGARMGVRHDGLVSGVGDFHLEAIDLGRRTRMRWVEELSFPWWLGSSIGAHVAGRFVLPHIWRGNLNNLKQLVEG